MEQPQLDHRAAGVALGLGYGLVLLALFHQPARGLAAATATPGTALVGVVLPILGLIAGGYVWLGWPGTAVVGLLAASILGVWGVALALVVTGDLPAVRVVGFGVVGLSVIAVLGSLRGVIVRVGRS